MTQDEKLFMIRADIKNIGPYLKKIAEQVLKEKISKYPIFVAHIEESVALGRFILDKKTTQTNYSYNVSLLEEMVKKELLDTNKIDDFRAAFKDPTEYACFFLLTPDEMSFVFCPYDLEKEWK